MNKEVLVVIRKAGQYMMLAGSLMVGAGGIITLAANGAMTIKDRNDPVLIAERKARKIKEAEEFNLRKAEHAAEAEAYAKERVAQDLDRVEAELAAKKSEITELESKLKEATEAAKKPTFALSIND